MIISQREVINMKCITRPKNLLFELFLSVKSAWLSDSPCPICKGGIKLCSFCDETQRDIEYGIECSGKEVEKTQQEEDSNDMDIPLESFLKKNQLKLETKLCGNNHYTKKRTEECENHGYVHDIETLKSHYGHPKVRKYFMHNLIKNKLPSDRLPSLPLELSNLFTNKFACFNSKQDDYTHYVHATIYTHDKSGRLRPPMCSLKCRTCGKSTSICVYAPAPRVTNKCLI